MREHEHERRFWALVDIRGPNDCWLWKGAVGAQGYGVVTRSIDGRHVYFKAHRLAYEFTNGPIDGSDRCVCHTCDVRLCCNPAHHWLGSVADNIRDMHRKGRARNHSKEKAVCKRGHALAGNSKPGVGCLICRRTADAARQREKRAAKRAERLRTADGSRVVFGDPKPRVEVTIARIVE
jgi:hypothetical protein